VVAECKHAGTERINQLTEVDPIGWTEIGAT
jgi:hypothetical protein